MPLNWTPEVGLFWATFALVVVTTLLVVAGAMQWWKMREHSEHLGALAGETKAIACAAKESADAAVKNAEAAITAVQMTYRPRLVIEEVRLSGSQLQLVTLSFEFKNVGPASALACHTRAVVKPGGAPLPVEGDEFKGDVAEVLAGSTSPPQVCAECIRLPERGSNVWLFAEVTYRGPLGDEHVVRSTFASPNYLFAVESGDPLAKTYRGGWDCDT